MVKTRSGSAQEFTIPQRVEELPPRQNGHTIDATWTCLQAHAQIPLQFLFLGKGPQGPQVSIGYGFLGLDLDGGVIAENEIDPKSGTRARAATGPDFESAVRAIVNPWT